MRYILRSGNKKAVSEHEHATVLLEQQLIAISKQAQQARHESFTTAARQTQFGSCDPVPRLYLIPPQIDRRSSEIDVIRYDIKRPTRGRPRMVARVITFHFRLRCPTGCFVSSPLCTSMEGFCRSQQSIIHVVVAHRYESHYRMQIACTSMHLAEGPPASVFRVPIARVRSLVFGTAHFKRVFVLWVVQIVLETASVRLELRPPLTMEL
jgi:hypothetical protein